jgi:2-hydroxychromene-2-carboxylate isomerase
MTDIAFYFDFSSPYGYLAAKRIDGIAARHGRGVDWRPFLLGVVFKELGGQPLTQYPLKGDYSRHDFDRSARRYGIPFTMPEVFPRPTTVAMRAALWIKQRDRARARAYCEAVYDAYFQHGRDIADVAILLDLAGDLGPALAEGLEDPALKALARAETEAAINGARAFGSPYFIVDGEPFWGNDRLEMIDEWLTRGGW